jgi:AsmA protein
VKRLALWGGLGAAALVALVLALAVVLARVLDLPKVQSLAASNASQILRRPVRFTSVSVRLLPVPRVELRGLEVAEDPRFGTEPFVTLERGFLSLQVRPLLGGRLEFGELRLERPLIRLVEGPDGTLNIASLGVVKDAVARVPAATPGRESPGRTPAPAASLLAGGVAIEKGTVAFVSRADGPREYRLVDVDLRVRGDGPSLAVGGRGTLTPGDVAIQLVDGQLALRSARSPSDAPLDGQVRVDAADIGPLVATLARAGLAVTGPLQARFTLSGVLGAPRMSGRVQLARPVVSAANPECRPAERTLSLEEIAMESSWAERTLLGRPVTARLAGGDVTANLSATLDRDVRVVVSDIAVRGVSLEPVLVEFLCDGYAVTGRLDLSAAMTLRVPDAATSVTGEGRFQIGRGRVVGRRALQLFGEIVKAVDVAAAVLGEEVASPFEFESIAGSYRLRDGMATTRDLVYTGRGFTATASGEYTLASRALNVDLLVRHRREDVKARVTGTAEAPVLRVDMLRSLQTVGGPVERGLHEMLRRLR